MAAQLVTKINRYIGTAAEIAAMTLTGIPTGSTFFESDTGILKVLNAAGALVTAPSESVKLSGSNTEETNGANIATKSNLVAGESPTGKQRPLNVDEDGKLQVGGITTVGIDQTTPGTTNKVVAELSGSNLTEGYIIPMFDLLAWSGFANQPAGDGVEIVSDNAGDTGKITIFGTTHGTGAFAYETVTLNGVTAVPTVKTDWGDIYGAFLGDIYGQNITPAVGTITLREASADQAITTIVATKISTGMVAFDLTGKQIILNVHSGNVWKRCGGVASTTTGFKLNLTGGNIKEEKIASMLYLISDTTGATAQIEVLA